MNPTELVELVQSGLVLSMKANDFVPVLLEPAVIAGHEGIKFEFKFGTGGGIETDRHALGYAFETDKRLYLILFHAAEIHYFPRMKPEVEKIVATYSCSASTCDFRHSLTPQFSLSILPTTNDNSMFGVLSPWWCPLYA